MRTLIAVIFFSCSAAWAQLPGLGETRPRPPEPEKQQEKAKLERPPQGGGRCDDLSGQAREDCLREEKNPNAAAGATRRPEPPTAPPPQNPR